MEIRLSSSLEDYLKTIYLIQEENTVARVKDIALRLGVASPSVTGAIKVLKKLRMVEHNSYGYIKLTESGLETAKKVFETHQSIANFLHLVLGIDIETAEEDACKIEHIIGPETTYRLAKFLEFSAAPSSECRGCMARFSEWMTTNINKGYQKDK